MLTRFFKDRFFMYFFVVFVLVLPLRLGQFTVNLISLEGQYAERRLRSMRGDTLPDKSEEIADGKSNFVAPGESLDCPKLNRHTFGD